MLPMCPAKHSNPLLFQMRLMEEELRDYQRAQDEALTKRQLLEQTLKDLEYELEAKSHFKDDRSRLVKQMEVCGACGWSQGLGRVSGDTREASFLLRTQPLGTLQLGRSCFDLGELVVQRLLRHPCWRNDGSNLTGCPHCLEEETKHRPKEVRCVYVRAHR